MLNNPIHIPAAEFNRIEAILQGAGPDPAYLPGSDILSGQLECLEGSGYFRVKNNKADDPTVIHKIHFTVYDASGTNIHESSHRITSLTDRFVIGNRTGTDPRHIQFIKA